MKKHINKYANAYYNGACGALAALVLNGIMGDAPLYALGGVLLFQYATLLICVPMLVMIMIFGPALRERDPSDIVKVANQLLKAKYPPVEIAFVALCDACVIYAWHYSDHEVIAVLSLIAIVSLWMAMKFLRGMARGVIKKFSMQPAVNPALN